MSVTGKTNIKDEELDAMLKEASGPINFTMFLNMFGAKLTGGSRGGGGRGSPRARRPRHRAFCWLLTPFHMKIQIFRCVKKP